MATERFSTARREKDFTLYSHKSGPNGWKIAHALEELGLEYETIYLDFQSGEQKSPGSVLFKRTTILILRIYQN